MTHNELIGRVARANYQLKRLNSPLRFIVEWRNNKKTILIELKQISNDGEPKVLSRLFGPGSVQEALQFVDGINAAFDLIRDHNIMIPAGQ